MPDSPDAVTTVVALARALRAAEVPATQERTQQAVRALSALDPTRRTDVYWAGRLTFCADPQHIARYDAVFAAVFGGPGGPAQRVPMPARSIRVAPHAPLVADPGEGEELEDSAVLRAAASSAEILRQRDIASMSPAELAALHRALAALALPGELRRSRRWRGAPHGPIDPARTVRALLRAGGEPVRPYRHSHRRRPRRVVLLVDVSGSMSAYADALLRFAHAATRRHPAPTEVFTIGTRLTRVTRAMASRNPQVALGAVGEQVPDWSGGTRLGALLREFLDTVGQRGLARGAVVVVLSDGWECDDAAALGEQMARLSRLAHRIVWANPRKGQPGYAPLAAGMAAALPYVDDFVAGHSLAALERLAAVVGGHARQPAAEVHGA